MKLIRTIVTGESCSICGYMGEHACSNIAKELTSKKEGSSKNMSNEFYGFDDEDFKVTKKHLSLPPEIIEWGAKISVTDCTKEHSPTVFKWIREIYELGHANGFVEGIRYGK